MRSIVYSIIVTGKCFITKVFNIIVCCYVVWCYVVWCYVVWCFVF